MKNRILIVIVAILFVPQVLEADNPWDWFQFTHVDGDVHYRQVGNQVFKAAAKSGEQMKEDYEVITGSNSYAEFQDGVPTVTIRVLPETHLYIVDVGQNRVQIYVTQGRVLFHQHADSGLFDMSRSDPRVIVESSVIKAELRANQNGWVFLDLYEQTVYCLKDEFILTNRRMGNRLPNEHFTAGQKLKVTKDTVVDTTAPKLFKIKDYWLAINKDTDWKRIDL